MKRFAWVLASLLPAWSVAAPARLAVDPAQSRIEVIVKATIDSFTGTLDAWNADITVDSGRVTAAVITFRFTDVHTGKAGRDEAMHEWQNSPRYPDGVFTLRSIETASGGRLSAHGVLVLHAVSSEIAFPVAITTDQKLYAIDGEAPLDTRQFGLPVIRKFGLLKVDPIVKVRFHLQGSVAVK